MLDPEWKVCTALCDWGGWKVGSPVSRVHLCFTHPISIHPKAAKMWSGFLTTLRPGEVKLMFRGTFSIDNTELLRGSSSQTIIIIRYMGPSIVNISDRNGAY